MKNNILVGLLLTILTLGSIGILSSNVFYPNEFNVKNILLIENISTITTKDGKCFMYQLKEGKMIAFKTCDEKVWEIVW
jgi:hypothetical protein